MKIEPTTGQKWIHWNTGDVCTVVGTSNFWVDGVCHEIVVTKAPEKPAYADPHAVLVWTLEMFYQSFRAIVNQYGTPMGGGLS